MFKARQRGRKNEPKQVPQWKQQMIDDEADAVGGADVMAGSKRRGRDADFEDGGGSRGRYGDAGQGGGEMDSSKAADHSVQGGDAGRESPGVPAAASSSKGTIDVDQEDDDDDDDVDLSNYQLDGVDEEEEKAALANAAPAPAIGRVLVSNLAFESSNTALENFFEGCGTILRIETPPTNRFERTAHVTFASQDEALLAVQKTGSKLDGRRLVVLLEPEVGALAAGPVSSRPDAQLATYGYTSAGRGNRYFGTVFADDDARSREKLRKREAKRSGYVGLGQPTGFPEFL
mmetsp:Transcript_3663/g.7800  ORF Transcript_3663/g.7800 Transcript_3663/m.7800 type:complete len:289 (-) Transcript_3663:573-1439(-)|eukprot:CAMPEP_0183347958 /NCGR_PEP_ID=MMETSP0164_2-20130417/12621_1 /TAXON_ID=221442 /ORGANISM="Coccolithus pelagicus ssp braarudi, Strain PLY182g" /LENGTH=288 /DNA_ID=CAMNT_0025519477 /DNA_START=69 /DNA_END=935 /DNA_ORIENTATION=-